MTTEMLGNESKYLLTKYETTRVLSTRIMELENNKHPLINATSGTSIFELACLELDAGLLEHIHIKRTNSRGTQIITANNCSRHPE